MTRTPYRLWCAGALVALAVAGCKRSEPAPTAPATPPPSPVVDEPRSALDEALDRVGLALPQVAGAAAVDSPVGDDGAWNRRTVLVGAAGAAVDGAAVQTLECPTGAASCAAPTGPPRTAWKPLVDALGEAPPALLAVDASLPIGVAASLLVALRSDQAPPTWLVRSGGALGTVSLEPAPRLLLPALIPSMGVGSLPREELLAKLASAQETGTPVTPEPARAPGRMVRVTTGPLAIAEVCGGIEAGRTLRRRMSAIRGCYREALGRTPKAAGRVVLEFGLAPDGRVMDTKLTKNETGDEGIAACISSEMNATQLPAREGDKMCLVSWELTMRTEEEALAEAPPTAPPHPSRAPRPTTPAPQVRLKLVGDGIRVDDAAAPIPLAAHDGLVQAIRAGANDRVEAVIESGAALPLERVLALAAAAREAGMAHVELEVTP